MMIIIMIMKEIDRLEREAVMDKMGELGNLNCSPQVMTMIIMMMFVMMMILQFRELVRSLGHTRDLQEIELLALNAKNLIYKVSRQMQKTVNSVMGEEIVATNVYHSLTRENSELLRRYCFYLKLDIKLKIQQL